MEELRRRLSVAGVESIEQLPLAAHSSLRIGGRARLAGFPTDPGELIACIRAAKACGIRYEIIGRASNLVFPDDGIEGLVIFTERMKACRVEGDCLIADAGISLAALATLACDNGLAGLEFAAGIPGSLGGALVMNAGAYGGCMGDVCIESRWYDREADCKGRFVGDAQGFAYRHSVYAENPRYIILGATVRLRRGARGEIDARMRELAAKRRATQPLERPSAGSAFKRPEGHFAGRLIEDSGLKGLRIGGAEVSQKHAGFIVNVGGATAADVRALVAAVQTRVLEKQGVMLEPEILFLE